MTRRDGLERERHRTQHFRERRHVEPGVGSNCRPVGFHLAKARLAFGLAIANRHRSARNWSTRDGALDQSEADVHAAMLSSNTVAASSTSRTTAVGMHAAGVACGWKRRYRDFSRVVVTYSSKPGRRVLS